LRSLESLGLFFLSKVVVIRMRRGVYFHRLVCVRVGFGCNCAVGVLDIAIGFGVILEVGRIKEVRIDSGEVRMGERFEDVDRGRLGAGCMFGE
jgi:hypothetical protein